MDQKRRKQHPPALENQEQFDRNDRVDHEIGIGDAREHLRSGKAGKQCVLAQFLSQAANPPLSNREL